MNLMIGGLKTTELNRRYESILLHNNIFGFYDSKVNLSPVLNSSLNSSKSLEGADIQKIGEYTITPSLQSFTNEDFEKIVDRGEVKSFQFRELRNLKIREVIKRIVLAYRPGCVTGIEFCRWLIEDSQNAPKRIQKKLPKYRGGSDIWLYFPGTLVRQINGEWQVLAARLDATGFHQEIMLLDGFWRNPEEDLNQSVVLYVD